MAVKNLREAWGQGAGVAVFTAPILLGASAASAAVAAAGATVSVNLWSLTAFFLKVGSIL
jgi:hypothetical protein